MSEIRGHAANITRGLKVEYAGNYGKVNTDRIIDQVTRSWSGLVTVAQVDAANAEIHRLATARRRSKAA